VALTLLTFHLTAVNQKEPNIENVEKNLNFMFFGEISFGLGLLDTHS
jgi:hypothetical protein